MVIPSPPILLTAFTPFAGRPDNPSQDLLFSLAAPAPSWLITETLPTEFARAAARVEQLLAEHRPRALLMLGLNERAAALHVERRAANFTDARIPDNAGQQPRGIPVSPTGPAAYPATLPWPLLTPAFDAVGIPWRYSDDAGAFVCNHTFYTAAHAATRLALRTPVGFLHIPDTTVIPLSSLELAMQDLLQRLQTHMPTG